ncbi:hypothetical protein IGI04_035209 [Brassica rapa subsp. trilocularis]|uniref:Uncharacterized protein n=1 Tax=Brassica rapa subsp. trilocularis TaxID=1813537 RepID=A0ABQ7LAZ9_BRACM|nr:hypothetical protein IGI04_035209 [Brassica rapa subsp. trilocularis]
MPSLKVGSIVKVDRFEVAKCSSIYKIIDHPFLICFISPTIIDEVITVTANINLELPDVVEQIVLSKALTLAKKQLESLSVSSLIRKKQSTHNFLYIIIYIVLTSIIKNISYPNSVVVYLSPLLINLILHKPLFCSLKETTTTQTIKSPKARILNKTNH